MYMYRYVLSRKVSLSGDELKEKEDIATIPIAGDDDLSVCECKCLLRSTPPDSVSYRGSAGD